MPDEYGTFRDTPGDQKALRELVNNGEPFSFCFCFDDATAYVVHLTPRIQSQGVLSFGGKQTGRVGLGVMGEGWSHFSPYPIHMSYFEEKLSVSPTTARDLERLWQMIYGDN